nr:hypothetical protein [Tanacetum cinerariifolium]
MIQRTSLSTDKALLNTSINQNTGKGAGFLWERVGKVMGSSWSSGEVVRSGEKAVAGLARVGMNSNHLKRGGEEDRGFTDGESSKEVNVKGDNKRARTRKVFAIITNPIRKEYTGLAPKCTNCHFHHNPETPCRACTNCNRLGHFARDCRAAPRMVNPMNARNPTVARGACFKYGGTNHYKSACPRKAFLMGAEEARQDPNIMIDVKPSSLAFSYEIKIASEKLVEISKVISDCKLELEGHTFDIDLIPFGYGSFNVIIGMDRVYNNALWSKKCTSGIHGFDELSLAGYYWRFIAYFSKIAKSHTISTQKHKKYFWGDEEEVAFQTLNDKLCNASALSYPIGPRDFMVYYDVPCQGLGYMLMQRGKVIAYASRQLKIYEKNYTTHDLELDAVIELFSDYNCEIRYHPGKANVVAIALRAQNEACEVINASAINAVRARRTDGLTLIMDGAHKSRYFVHPRADKMYYDLRDMYWWPGMKKDITFMRCAPFEELYGRKCRSPILWAKVGEGKFIKPEIMQETTKKISQIKDRLTVACDRQKSYANKRRKPLEFNVGNHVLLKVSP